MPPYSLRRQRQIVIVARALHNFIKMEMQSDRDFIGFQNEDLIVEDNDGEHVADIGPSIPLSIGTAQGQQEIARV